MLISFINIIYNGGIFTSLDYNKIYSSVDLAMKVHYFDICTMDTNVMIMDQLRSLKYGKKFWITETGVGMCGIGKPSHKEQFKAWMWSSFAHGADACVVFRWETCLSDQELELEGMLEHWGYPGHRYKKIKAAFRKMGEISAGLGDLPLPEPEIAIVHDYDVMWGYQANSTSKEYVKFSYFTFYWNMGHSSSDGTNVIQYADAGNTAQKWQLIKVQ